MHIYGRFQVFTSFEFSSCISPSILSFALQVETKGMEIFIRKAERFNAFIVALLSASAISGYVQDLSSVCDRVTPRLVYPPKMGLSEGVQIKSKSVYLVSDNSQSVYVFECT